MLVDPDGAVERRLAEGLLAVPALLHTSREKEEEGRWRKDGEASALRRRARGLLRGGGAGPFGCKVEIIDE